MAKFAVLCGRFLRALNDLLRHKKLIALVESRAPLTGVSSKFPSTGGKPFRPTKQPCDYNISLKSRKYIHPLADTPLPVFRRLESDAIMNESREQKQNYQVAQCTRTR